MNNKAKDILLNILEVIDYQGDRNNFADKFLDLIFRQAILKEIENLPEDKKHNFDRELKDKDLDKSMQVILNYVQKEDFEKSVERIATEMFIDYIQKILPTLDEVRKNKLQTLLNTLAKT